MASPMLPSSPLLPMSDDYSILDNADILSHQVNLCLELRMLCFLLQSSPTWTYAAGKYCPAYISHDLGSCF